MPYSHHSRLPLRVALLAVLCGVALLAACGAPSRTAARSAPQQPTPIQVPNFPFPGATPPTQFPSYLPPGAPTKPMTTKPVTLVVLGASDAFGVGTDDPDRLNWPSDLTGEIGPNVHLVNLGIPGATLAQATRDELPIGLSVHPDIVTVWLAVNDFASGVDVTTYGEQLAGLLASLRQNTHAAIYVANLPDLSLVPYFNGQDLATLRAQVQAWNDAIAAVCAHEGAHLVDLASGWKDLADHPEYISGDGLHPSTIGAQRIADAFAAVIRQSGGA